MDREQIYREITILSLEQALALPYGTYRLVQEGMRVIRIEAPPRGDPNRYVEIEAVGEGGMNSYCLSVNARNALDAGGRLFGGFLKKLLTNAAY